MPPFGTVSAEMSESTPSVLNDDVAVAPKYEGPYAEKIVDEAFPKVARPVCTDVPVTLKFPSVEILVLIIVEAIAVATALKMSPTAIART